MKATVVFLIRDGKILLAKKTKKVGIGLWNGYGGKSEPQDLSLRHTAARELAEESGGITISPEDIVPRALMDFYMFGNNTPEPDFSVAMYTAEKFEGEAVSTEEMENPTWFLLSEIPYENMLPADRDFLPRIISGNEVFRGKVWFTEGFVSVVRSEYVSTDVVTIGI